MRIVIKPLGAITLLVCGLIIGTVALHPLREKRVAATRTTTTFELVADSGKKAWLLSRLYRYNVGRPAAAATSSDGTQMPLRLRDSCAADRADAMDRNETEPPRLWSYSGIGWSAVGSGEAAPRTLFVTPLVLVTTKTKAASLRPYLSGAMSVRSTFVAMEELVQGKGSKESKVGNEEQTVGKKVVANLSLPLPTPNAPPPPPRSLTFTHADPTTTADGLYVRGLLLADFAARTKTTTVKAAADPAFAAFVRRLYQGFKPADPALAADPTALARAFARDPSRADVLICAESDALLVVRENHDLVVLTPGPTTLTPQSVAVVGLNRLAPGTRQRAEEMLTAFSCKEAITDALRAGFRPPGGGRSPGLARYAAQGFLPSITDARPLPPLSLMEKVARL